MPDKQKLIERIAKLLGCTHDIGLPPDAPASQHWYLKIELRDDDFEQITGYQYKNVQKELDAIAQAWLEAEKSARARMRFNLILFTAEYTYCKANGFKVGEGYEPPSMIYESMEAPVDKWLASREPKETQTNE